MSLQPPEAELLAELRRATDGHPFADPVIVHGRPMSRRDARTAERALARLAKINVPATPSVGDGTGCNDPAVGPASVPVSFHDCEVAHA